MARLVFLVMTPGKAIKITSGPPLAIIDCGEKLATTASELSQSVADAQTREASVSLLWLHLLPQASVGREGLKVVCVVLSSPRFWGVPGRGAPGTEEPGGHVAGCF